jgi:hypothetical protein
MMLIVAMSTCREKRPLLYFNNVDSEGSGKNLHYPTP